MPRAVDLPRALLCTLLLLGCDDNPSAELSVSLTLEAPNADVRFTAQVGGRVLEARSREGASVERRVVDPGTYLASVVLSGLRGQELRAEVPVTLRGESANWIAAHVGMQRPFGHCFGEIRHSVPIEPGGPDTLWVMTGALPHGAVC